MIYSFFLGHGKVIVVVVTERNGALLGNGFSDGVVIHKYFNNLMGQVASCVHQIPQTELNALRELRVHVGKSAEQSAIWEGVSVEHGHVVKIEWPNCNLGGAPVVLWLHRRRFLVF
jgi:hypothetical protein